nr:hypothetical protein [uncultured Pseudomonas sp.]
MQNPTIGSLGILHLERGASAENNDGALLPGSLLNPEVLTEAPRKIFEI